MALKQYLLEHPFGLVTTSDLLKSLSTSTGLDLIHQFNPWIKSKGYPVVKVSIASIESSSITFHFEQTKFQLWKTKESQDLWPIVLNATIVIRNSSGTKFETISTRLDDKATKYSYTIPNGYQFQSFLLNPDRIGFYRTLYSQDLLDHVNLLPFGISDKSGFISDLIALLLSGHYKLDSNWLDRFFSRLHFIQNDTTVEVWESFLNHVSKVEVAIRSSKYHDMLLRGIHSILEPIMKKMTWQTKKHPLESIKSEIFLSAVKYNHQPTINQAIAYFNTSDYDPFLINVVTEAAIRYDGRFDQVCKSIETGNFKTISVLAATQDISQQAMLIKHYINTVQLHDILVKLLDYGNFEIVWRTIKDFEFGNVSKFDLLLEETTSQFQSKTLIRDAKRRKTRGIQRGLEKANAYKHLRATLIKT
jgi:hypothetical protein